MRYARGLHRLTLAAALVALAVAPGAAQLGAADWAIHRGTPTRIGANAGSAFVSDLQQVYLWPNTRDLPAEIVVDDAPPDIAAYPAPAGGTYPTPTGQNFTTAGTWTAAPALPDRSPGAWPFTDDTAAAVIGGYQYTPAVQSTVLAGIDPLTLAKLPNLGTGADAAATYATINTELVTNGTTYARWSFGTAYPLGTGQGLRPVAFDVANGGVGSYLTPFGTAFRQPLQPGQRYAVYIRWPSMGTTIAGVVHPHTDNVFVRVSWGSDPNDPSTSRIFLVNMGETGGFWYRIRTGVGDDRYFPYDGTNPIQVTLYTLTPDAVADTNQFPVTPIISADAVRLVPEAFRGDIHDSAASAAFTSVATSQPVRLTYFGRDETVGPLRLIQNATYLAQLKTEYTSTPAWQQPVAPFTGILFNPTAPPDTTSTIALGFNPVIPDPTTSIRTANFYSLSDDSTLARYGQLRWRYTANTAPVATSGGGTTVALPTSTIDDNSAGCTVDVAGFSDPAITSALAQQTFGTTFRQATAVAYGTAPTPRVTWTATLPVKGFPADPTTGFWTGQTYTVMAWLPAVANPVHFAHYQIDTLYGPSTVFVDQRMTSGLTLIGGWRVIATHVRFPFVSGNQVGTVHLLADAPSYPAPAVAPFTETQRIDVDDVGQSRVVLADAIQFVPESLTPASVVGAPHIAVDRQANGTTTPFARTTVHFVTDETTAGHVWALDAFGPDAVGGPPTSTLTTAFWVYPSLLALNADPNYGAAGNRDAIDGEVQVTNLTSYSIVAGMPALAGFRSSPIYVESAPNIADPNRTQAFASYLIAGNQNGRLYGLDPIGRGDSVVAAADVAGAPGTTQRLLTWPTAARDKYRITSGTFSAFTDDPGKTAISAAPAAHPIGADPFGLTDLLVVGAGDGHVYAFDPSLIDLAAGVKPSRMYAYTSGGSGVPLWQYPSPTVALDPITFTGAITTPVNSAQAQYIFPAGGRMYGINIASINTAVTPHEAPLRWAFPFANPESPASSDLSPMDLPFTSPLWQPAVGTLNGGNEATFVANEDGVVRALDSTVGIGTPAVTTELWNRSSLGPTRSSPVLVTNLRTNIVTPVTAAESLMMPYDNGLILGLKTVDGTVTWGYNDGDVGAVPVTDANTLPAMGTTSYVFRGPDAITANGFVYNGDEGLLDTGEVNGQFHAYGDAFLTGGGGFVPYEPGGAGLGANGLFDLRGTDLVLDTTFNQMVTTPAGISGATAMGTTYIKPDSGTLNSAVYDWGESIYVVAWGAYVSGSMPSQVQFRVTGRGANRTVSATIQADSVYAGPPLFVNDLSNTPQPALAWVASTKIPLGLPSEQDPQTPGSQYRISVQVQNTSGAKTLLQDVGRRFQQDGSEDTTSTPPSRQRSLSVASPLALSTGGAPIGTVLGGTNTIGWINDSSASGAWTQLLANGNKIATMVGSTLGTGNAIDLYAPLGAIAHGSSKSYAGVTGLGAPVPALYVVDRSKLGLMSQRLKNVRIDRGDLAWGWDTTSGDATGNVMNPLPWETYPSSVPNVSPDYPDIDRKHISVRLGGVDLSSSGVSPSPIPTGSTTATPLDLSVSVPRFQPANVNAVYFDINSAKSTTGYAPMVLGATGGTPATTGAARFPSAGYVANARIFVGIGAREAFDPRFAYREMRIGIGVPPDLAFHTVEETLDLGTVPHSLGFTPIASGSATNAPFAPSDPFGVAGPYGAAASPFDVTNSLPFLSTPNSPVFPQFFAPFTIVSESNVNLVDLRIAKMIGNSSTSVTDPTNWLRFTSSQVKAPAGPELTEPMGAGQIFAEPTFPVAGGAGNFGIVSSLDHARTNPAAPAVEIDYPTLLGTAGTNFWPRPDPIYGSHMAPTLHKPRPDDPVGTTMTVPDVAYGDPKGELTTTPGDLRPRIGVAVPLGTPAGTYTAPVTIFEDGYPLQWRNWLGNTAINNGVDNGVLDVSAAPLGTTSAIEAVSPRALNVKITVSEAKLTNDQARTTTPADVLSQRTRVQTNGAYLQADQRAWDATAGTPQGVLGGNLQPTALRSGDPNNGGMFVYWTTNRLPATDTVTGDPYAPPAIQNTPWLLTGSRLGAVINPATNVFDWTFADATRWWSAPIAPYPDPATATVGIRLQDLFPSVQAAGDTPVSVAGTPMPNTVRQTEPALTLDLAGTPWLFWQGEVQKSGTNGSQLDTRTFYQPIDPATGAPATGSSPQQFANDPAMPKFGPKPIVVKLGAVNYAYLFWYGGPTGRTRLYYNVTPLTGNSLSTASGWSGDTALPTPGALLWMSDPVPVPRNTFNVDDSGNATPVQAIDLVYTGMAKGRNQAETFLTRYQIDPATGTLNVARQPHVDSATLARDGVKQTWVAPDLAWLYQANGNYIDANTPNHAISISVTHAGVTTTQVNDPATPPTYDPATNRLYFVSKLGGQLYIDPQAGTVTFPDVAPGTGDTVMASYTPRSARLNASRNATPGVPAVQASGANTDPVAFLDNTNNWRPDADYLSLSGGSKPVCRLWLLYRKAGGPVTGSGAIYYKTMRLTVQLQAAVQLNGSGVPNITALTPTRALSGPVEVDWVRGRLYFTEADEGNIVSVSYTDASGNPRTVNNARVQWADEGTTSVLTANQPAPETPLPTTSSVNEGQISAFKDPFQDKVWVFWTSTRDGVSDIFYEAISPRFYADPR